MKLLICIKIFFFIFLVAPKDSLSRIVDTIEALENKTLGKTDAPI